MAKSSNNATNYIRLAMLGVAFLLPALSLVVLGSMWLWQHGYLIHWAIIAAILTTTIYALEAYVLRDLIDTSHKPATDLTSTTATVPDREQAALASLATLSRTVTANDLRSRDHAIALAIKTVEAMARRMHPEDPAPLLKFTVPQALAVVERVSAQLGTRIATHVPFGERLTVRQLFAIYKWRNVASVAVKTYDLWRIIRLLNPAVALASELRERLTGQLLEHGREQLAIRLARAYVDAIGHAAIDLYSGRLRNKNISHVDIIEP